MKKLLLLPFLALAFVACDQHDQPKQNQYSGLESNSTGFNLSATENPADKTVTLKIRQALMSDRSLSTNAQSINIMTNDGVVTLRGVVPNTSERDAILNKVKSVQGTVQVDNQLEVSK